MLLVGACSGTRRRDRRHHRWRLVHARERHHGRNGADGQHRRRLAQRSAVPACSQGQDRQRDRDPADRRAARDRGRHRRGQPASRASPTASAAATPRSALGLRLLGRRLATRSTAAACSAPRSTPPTSCTGAHTGAASWITVYANSGHAFMMIAGLRFDTGFRDRVTKATGAAPGSGPRWGGPRSTRGYRAATRWASEAAATCAGLRPRSPAGSRPAGSLRPCPAWFSLASGAQQRR